MGMLFEVFETVALSPLYRSFLTIGFLGAFTTFSTFSLETVNLLRDGEWKIAFLNVTTSVVIGIGLTMTGMLMVRVLLKGPR